MKSEILSIASVRQPLCLCDSVAKKAPSCRRAVVVQNRRGFTLIEVLAAIFILVIVLPIIMYGLTLATSTAGLARHRTQATTLAQSKLNELLATGDWQNASTGDFSDRGFPEYKWNTEIVTFDSPTTDGLTTSLQELHLNVTWMQRNQPQQITLATLVYQNASTNNGGL